MSNALALAAVTAVLKDLLDSGLIDHRVTDALGEGVTVSAIAPDAIELGANASPRLNLFLHQVTPNAAWRNAELPALDSRGRRIANPPLALDLHYLLTAYGSQDLQAEVLLGYAMQLFHETPVLTRGAIRLSLSPPAPVEGALLPTLYRTLRAADLAEQLELIKITPAPLGSEEMSRLWSALQANYRPTAAYTASVVLIESARPARSGLPVLRRGPLTPDGDDAIDIAPSTAPRLPLLNAVAAVDGYPAARLGQTVRVLGHQLTGASALTLRNDRFALNLTRPPLAGASATQLEFALPADPLACPVGVYLVAATITRPTATVSTNELALLIGPEIATPLPASFTRDAQGRVTIDLDCSPAVRPGQRASLLLGEREIPALPVLVPSTQLRFLVDDAQVGAFLVRLRVDGIDSPLIDRASTPPTFLNRRVQVA
jgi:hypothetical protein